MDLDAKVCLCFHISRRKLVNFIRIERPCVASQLSQCGGAGTGCGWCVPFLKQLFQSSSVSPVQQTGSGAGATELDRLPAGEYERRRAEYIRAGKGTPPPGATPLRDEGDAEESPAS